MEAADDAPLQSDAVQEPRKTDEDIARDTAQVDVVVAQVAEGGAAAVVASAEFAAKEADEHDSKLE